MRRRSLMSHDIDLIVEPEERDAVFAIADEHSESRHFGAPEWRAELDGRPDDAQRRSAIHVDLYVPYQSRLGQRLRLAVEALVPFAETIDEWHVLDVDTHVATKLAALLDRPETFPGQKDREELFGLLDEVDPERLGARLARASQLPTDQLVQSVGDGFDFLEDLSEVGRAERRQLREIARGAVVSIEICRPPEADGR